MNMNPPTKQTHSRGPAFFVGGLPVKALPIRWSVKSPTPIKEINGDSSLSGQRDNSR